MKSSTKRIISNDDMVAGWAPTELEDLNMPAQDFDLDEEKLRLVELFSQLNENDLNLKKTKILKNIKTKPWRPSSLEEVLAAELSAVDDGEDFHISSEPVIVDWHPAEFISHNKVEDYLESPSDKNIELYDKDDVFEVEEESFDVMQYSSVEDDEIETDEENQADDEVEALNSEEIDAIKEEILVTAQLEADAMVSQMVQEAQIKADNYLQLTYAEAEVVRLQMDFESDRLWRQANVELEALKEQAHQEGVSHGYQEIEMVVHASKEILEQFSTWRAGMLEKSEDAVIDMVKEIAKIIFSDGVELNQTALHENFSRILSESRALGDLRVYVNPEDMKILDPSWKDYQVQISGQSIKIYPTEAIRRGGCYVEGQQGSIDARVENQLTAILDSLSASDEIESDDKVADETPAQFTWL